MDAVDREELICLLTEALMRDSRFRPRRGHRPPTRIDASSRPGYARPVLARQ